jgi:hypothetical protein
MDFHCLDGQQAVLLVWATHFDTDCSCLDTEGVAVDDLRGPSATRGGRIVPIALAGEFSATAPAGVIVKRWAGDGIISLRLKYGVWPAEGDTSSDGSMRGVADSGR